MADVHAQRAARPEALRGDCGSDAFEGIAPDHEMAALRISEIQLTRWA